MRKGTLPEIGPQWSGDCTSEGQVQVSDKRFRTLDVRHSLTNNITIPPFVAIILPVQCRELSGLNQDTSFIVGI